jgi:hypothetical protein
MNIQDWLVAHATTIGAVLAAWSFLASILNRTFWPKPQPEAAAWKRWLHWAVVDVPAFLASRGWAGQLGPVSAPFMAASKKLGAASTPPPAALLVLVLAALGFAGCAAGVADTYVSLTVKEQALKLAAKKLPEIDRQLQYAGPSSCVKLAATVDQSAACRKSVQVKIETARKATAAGHDEVVMARDMVKAVPKGQISKDIWPWINLAMRGYNDLKALFSDLGFPEVLP